MLTCQSQILISKLNIPEPAEKNILEFLNYKLRNGKYIKQMSKDIPIYKLLLERPIVKFRNFYDYEYYNNYDYEDTNYNYNEIFSNEQLDYFNKYNIIYKYFIISFDIKFYKFQGSNVVKMMHIKYSYFDKNKYSIEYRHYYVYNDSHRHEYIPN